MNSNNIIKIDKLVRSKFTYKLDDGDHWRSFAKEVKAGKEWQGDCDDLATTTIQMLSEQGVKSTSLARACVSSTNGKKIDHMIAFCKDDKGIIWVIGDTFGSAYRLDSMKHRPIFISLVSEGIKWVEVRSITDIKLIFGK